MHQAESSPLRRGAYAAIAVCKAGARVLRDKQCAIRALRTEKIILTRRVRKNSLVSEKSRHNSCGEGKEADGPD